MARCRWHRRRLTHCSDWQRNWSCALTRPKRIVRKISARNHFPGKITHLVEGPVSTEVTIEISPKFEIVSVITTNSARRLGLKVGLLAHALIKADSVIVAVD
jgi:molybdopterin-binding protein